MNREPTPEDLRSPEFNAIWEVIKKWDIDRGINEERGNYSNATGTDVMDILNALTNSYVFNSRRINQKIVELEKEKAAFEAARECDSLYSDRIIKRVADLKYKSFEDYKKVDLTTSTLRGREESTLQEMIIINKRRCGNTIRIIDHAIQMLFDGKIVVVRDHYQNGASARVNKSLLLRIIERLQNEHDMDSRDVIIDYNNLTIQLANNEMDI